MKLHRKLIPYRTVHKNWDLFGIRIKLQFCIRLLGFRLFCAVHNSVDAVMYIVTTIDTFHCVWSNSVVSKCNNRHGQCTIVVEMIEHWIWGNVSHDKSYYSLKLPRTLITKCSFLCCLLIDLFGCELRARSFVWLKFPQKFLFCKSLD